MLVRELERLLEPFEHILDVYPDYPAVNVWVNGDHAIVTAELPGIDKETLDISVSGDTLTLRGSRPLVEDTNGGSYHRHELWHGDFKRTIQLPFNIDVDKVKATYKNGILQVTLQQLESEKPRKIEIKSE